MALAFAASFEDSLAYTKSVTLKTNKQIDSLIKSFQARSALEIASRDEKSWKHLFLQTY
jgi:hypothetical protein